jgi:ferredoxin
VFSRCHLIPGSKRFEEYYRQYPEKNVLDARFRSKPGLLTKGTTYYNPYLFAAAQASFTAVSAFHAVLDRNPIHEQFHPSPVRISKFIKQWSKKLGALSVGITELRNYHLYSHTGRGEPYGQPINLEHKFAIALTVEMDKRTLDRAPYGPAIMESAQQYLAAGVIAIQLAEFIRNLGYSARAHIDGNYRVVCPLVARDAGLGEIGRIGLLITPEVGPRVRLAIVTTDLPLVTDPRTRDYSVIDFCNRCAKCAVVCPSRAIPLGNRTEIDGIRRWQIRSEACFTFWCTAGTDCGRCVRVCPYSHSNNAMHNVIRLGVRNSPIARATAVKLEDLFYEKKPAPSVLPNWMNLGPISSNEG